MIKQIYHSAAAGLLAINLCSAQSVPTPVALWEFEDVDNLNTATIGSDLAFTGTITPTPGSGGLDAGAANVPVNAFITATNPIGATNGGANTNEYTIVMDIQLLSSPSFAALLEFGNVTNDGDYFRSTSRGLGVASEGYVGSAGDLPTSTWVRFALSYDPDGNVTTYINGNAIGNHSGASGIDGRWSIQSSFDVFSDRGGGEEAVSEISNLALYNRALDATEIADLGAVGTPFANVVIRDLVWTGLNSNEWSLNEILGDKNWQEDGEPADFTEFANVAFTDSANSGDLELNQGDISASEINFTSDTLDYTISGTDGITNAALLTKAGNAKLTINNENNFIGPVDLTAGTLALANPLALANASLTTSTDGGTLSFEQITSATLGNLNGDAPLTLENSTQAPVALSLSGGNFTGELSGSGSLIKESGASLVLDAVSTFSGGTTVAGGSIQPRNPQALGSSMITIDGGNLRFSFGNGTASTFANDLTLPTTGQQLFFVRGTNNNPPTELTSVTLSGKISGGAADEIFRIADSGTGLNHNSVIILDNPANDFEGILEMWRGRLAITSDAALGAPTNSIRHFTENLSGALRFDADNIVLNPQREIIFPGSNVNPRPIDTQAFNATIAGPISGTANFIKQGTGTLTLSGFTDFTGLANVAEGTLALTDDADLGQVDAIILADNATLDLNNFEQEFLFADLTGNGSVIGDFILDGSRLSPGIDSNPIGTLTTGNLILDFALFDVQIDSSLVQSDRLVVLGDLDIDFSSTIQFSDIADSPQTIPGGTKLALVEYTGTWNGNPFEFDNGSGFVELNQGDTVTIGSNNFTIDYQDDSDGIESGKFITLTSTGPTATPLENYLAGFGVTGAAAALDNDVDGDGIANGLEFLFGSNPTQPSNEVIPSLVDSPSALTFVFRRNTAATDLTASVEYSTDLTSWTIAQDGVNNVTVVTTPNGFAQDIDRVEVTLPKTLSANGSLFARLNVE